MQGFKITSVISLLGMGILLLTWGCKPIASGLKTAPSEIVKPTTDFEEIFRRHVNAERFEEALKLACSHYDLTCSRMSVSHDNSRRVRAVTYPYTNQIVLYPEAFRFLGMPHAGWLASIIEHENFHTRQSMYIRAVVMGAQARILGDRTYEAGVEYEAWDYQLKQAAKFNLNCEMILEIERQLYYYGKILQNKGQGPVNEEEELTNYTMPDREQRVVRSRCERSRQTP